MYNNLCSKEGKKYINNLTKMQDKKSKDINYVCYVSKIKIDKLSVKENDDRNHTKAILINFSIELGIIMLALAF